MLDIIRSIRLSYCKYCKTMSTKTHHWCSICNKCSTDKHTDCNIRYAEIICKNNCNSCEIMSYQFRVPTNYYCDYCKVYSFRQHYQCIMCNYCSDQVHKHCNTCLRSDCSATFKCNSCNTCSDSDHFACDTRNAITE